MKLFRLTRAKRVETEADRQKALAVLKATYQDEKAWVLDVEPMFSAIDLERQDVSWFLATRREKPVGVLRVLYNPPVEQYLNYDLKPIDKSFEIETIMKKGPFAEIGRFAVVPERRNGIAVALSLMRSATREVVSRGFTQLVTDVFENDPHSPFRFHTRVIGFQLVATHEVGEFRVKGRRMTLLLDIKAAYQSLKSRGTWFFRVMTKGWTQTMHKGLAT
jgi:hypothetical protein